MMGSFLTRALIMVLGYAYPAYECYKTVELNKPEIEQLRFWCQYWILVAALTVFERVGDAFVSWLPMYSEAKLAFFVYLWYPKTKGTTYVYDTFFRPYVAKHENEIDRNLLELRTRAGDILILYWQKAASYGQSRFFEILQYVAAQSQPQPSRPRPVQQRLQSLQNRRAPAANMPPNQTAPSQLPQQPTQVPASPTKSQQPQEAAKGSTSPAAPAVQPQISSAASVPENAAHPAPAEAEAMQVDAANAAASENQNPPPEETPMEEAIRITRGRLRKRAAAGGPSGH